MSTFKIIPDEVYGTCHTYQCHNRIAFKLGKEDTPRGTEFLICEQCAQELKDSIAEELVKGIEEAILPFADEPKELVVAAKAFNELTVPELKEFAEGIGITGISKKTKAELIELIESHE
ncbi:TPA: Rho termination factor N-terminal domain-containing protein [Listeria monocytogenes]|nr:Rho termination factor N-terminal domain-containing protein [Listeria monocytogenes]